MTPRLRTTRRPRGFTLIELMVVVTIIGILSSVAIPEFGRMVLRAKAAERHEVMLRMKKAVADLYVQKGSIPGGVLLGDFQPVPPLAMSRRAPDWMAAGWSTIFQSTEEIEGALYYSYRVRADDTTAPPQLEIWAIGDLDGDGLPSVKYMLFQRTNGIYHLAIETPGAGAEDQLTF